MTQPANTHTSRQHTCSACGGVNFNATFERSEICGSAVIIICADGACSARYHDPTVVLMR